MKVDLKSLLMGSMESGEFHLTGRGRDLFLSDIGGRFMEELDVHLIIENTGQLFVGRGQVSTTIALTCGRCLEEFEYSIISDLDFTASESLRYGDADECILIQDKELEIMPRIEEEIFSALPLNPLCSEECKGLCPLCGINRNLSICSCEKNDIDPRWEKLEKLK